MELSFTDVEKARNVLSEIIKSTKQLTDLNQLKALIEEDDNFYLFLIQTGFGSVLYDKIIELIEIVINDLYFELDTLNNYTYNYLNRLYEEKVNL